MIARKTHATAQTLAILSAIVEPCDAVKDHIAELNSDEEARILIQRLVSTG